MMKVSDYIVEFLIKKGIKKVFGYPGGSVTNLMESFRIRQGDIDAYVVYHEQAAAFEACAYAEMSGVPGVAYATGGPGATNMMTAIGHAYYDSIPLICLTGNVNTYEAHGDLQIRQRGFQESDIISVVKPLTKCVLYVNSPVDIRYCLEKAYDAAMSGRKGPVLLDLPMDVLRAQVNPQQLRGFHTATEQHIPEESTVACEEIKEALVKSKTPVIVWGKGVDSVRLRALTEKVVSNLKIPCVTSMISFDILTADNPYYYGFIGAYGVRAANLIVAKSDLVIAIGSRLDIRQVGASRENFAQEASIIRIDIDRGELSYKVHEDEQDFCADAEKVLSYFSTFQVKREFAHWNQICRTIRSRIGDMDERLPNKYIREISRFIPEDAVITTDVGQNQVWVAQSFQIKARQRVLFSGGMGAMGYALPAAIGAFYGKGSGPVICVCGDGGMQMNIQELQFVSREHLPVKIVVLNNNALGMIRQFQEMYFNSISYQTNPEGGYTTPDFTKVAEAYGIRGIAVEKLEELEELKHVIIDEEPVLIEIRIREDTYVFPKLEYGKPNYDQQPLLDRKVLKELMDL